MTSREAKTQILNSRETETMSIQKKSLVSTLKTTRKANLVKDESAATVSSATKAPARMLPSRKLTSRKLTSRKLTSRKLN
jgi:hypothetical protein